MLFIVIMIGTNMSYLDIKGLSNFIWSLVCVCLFVLIHR